MPSTFWEVDEFVDEFGHLLMITTATVHINVWPFIYGSNFTAHISND